MVWCELQKRFTQMSQVWDVTDGWKLMVWRRGVVRSCVVGGSGGLEVSGKGKVTTADASGAALASAEWGAPHVSSCSLLSFGSLALHLLPPT